MVGGLNMEKYRQQLKKIIRDLEADLEIESETLEKLYIRGKLVGLYMALNASYDIEVRNEY